MTSRFTLIAALCVLILFAVAGCSTTYSDPPGTAYVEAPPPPPPPELEFYELNEYGEWIDVHPHGPVWRPYAPPDWRPYLYGHWVWSEWGWTWVSYEPFSWAVYHYGYWRFSTMWGWIWIPGYEWEPVRVRWAHYDDYVCWAPAPPPGYYLPDPWLAHSTELWVVVRPRDFTQHDLHRFQVEPPQYKDRYHSGVTVYRESPRLDVIERHTRRTVPHVDLKVRKYRSGSRVYNKVVLPESEKQVIKKYKPQLKKQAASEDKSSTGQKQRTKGKTKGSSGKKTKSTDKKKDGG